MKTSPLLRAKNKSLLSICCMTMLLGSALFCSAQDDQTADQSQDESHTAAFFETEVVLDVQPGKKAYDVEWSFVNVDKIPLTVDRIVSSCDSLSIETKQISVLGRHLGIIKACFRPGHESGVVRESVRVYFVGYDKPVELVMEASVPAQVELTSTNLK